jgi:flagellar basal-body rod protein FlgC
VPADDAIHITLQGTPTMSVFDTIRIAASGLTAQRLRMDVAASNIANAQTTRNAAGTGPYEPESVVFRAQTLPGSSNGGIGTAAGNLSSLSGAAPGVAAVAIVTQNRDPLRVYDPTHPDADVNGFVSYPDVDIAAEMADMMGAARSYSLNATITASAKQTALDAIEIGRG